MRILAFYTASEPPSVALRTPDVESVRVVETRSAVEELMPRAAELLRAARCTAKELDGVAIARGPGSFTGLRVGAGAALGLTRGAGLPLFAVGTLDAWAAAALGAPDSPSRCHVALDARRGEVYLATFSARSEDPGDEAAAWPERLDGPRVVPVTEAAKRLEPGVLVVGDARQLLEGAGLDASPGGFTRPPEPLALWIARLVASDPSAAAVALEGLALDYLRQPQAVTRAAGAGGAGA